MDKRRHFTSFDPARARFRTVAGERHVVVQMGNETKVFRRLKEGDVVQKDQLLALVDKHAPGERG